MAAEQYKRALASPGMSDEEFVTVRDLVAEPMTQKEEDELLRNLLKNFR